MPVGVTKTYERPVAQVREQLVLDLELWRRLPWLVLLYRCGRTGTPTSWHAAHRQALFGDITITDAIQGHFPISEARPKVVIDCRDGALIANRHGGKRRILCDREVEDFEADTSSVLHPHTHLAVEADLLDGAHPREVKRLIVATRITPRWAPADEALDGTGAMLLALAGSWTGSIASLLDASGLLLA